MPYIGHLLTAQGVRADLSKVEAMLQMTKPQDEQGVRRILGMTNYSSQNSFRSYRTYQSRCDN
jgi:hypothetical protein